jgi:hypothetical protein
MYLHSDKFLKDRLKHNLCHYNDNRLHKLYNYQEIQSKLLFIKLQKKKIYLKKIYFFLVLKNIINRLKKKLILEFYF